MRVATETQRRAGVTLVAVRVENDASERQRVRLANRCDGDVLPPRADGLPKPGWDDGGWEGELAPGEVRPLGYATTGEPAATPVEVAWTDRAASGSPSANELPSATGTPSASEAVADFGDPRPPRDAVTPPASGLPDAVREWLDDVATRASDEQGETAPSRATAEADRETLSALAARVSVLRERVRE